MNIQGPDTQKYSAGMCWKSYCSDYRRLGTPSETTKTPLKCARTVAFVISRAIFYNGIVLSGYDPFPPILS
jgi:hypothetical protein